MQTDPSGDNLGGEGQVSNSWGYDKHVEHISLPVESVLFSYYPSLSRMSHSWGTFFHSASLTL